MKTCDICEETWEDSFFCAKCSGPHIETETCPDPMWDFDDRTPDIIEREVTVLLTVCGNCCTCYGV